MTPRHMMPVDPTAGRQPCLRGCLDDRSPTSAQTAVQRPGTKSPCAPQSSSWRRAGDCRAACSRRAVEARYLQSRWGGTQGSVPNCPWEAPRKGTEGRTAVRHPQEAHRKGPEGRTAIGRPSQTSRADSRPTTVDKDDRWKSKLPNHDTTIGKVDHPKRKLPNHNTAVGTITVSRVNCPARTRAF